MSVETLPVAFRPMAPSDEGFIFDSWLKEYRLSPFGTQISSSVFYPGYRKLVAQIIAASTVTVACNPEDPDQIYGYAVHRMIGQVRVLSWIAVKSTWKGMGLGKALFSHIGGADVVTHISKQYKVYWDPVKLAHVSKLPEGLIYNPFLDLNLMKE